MKSPKPNRRAKSVTLSPAHLDTIREACGYLLEEVNIESASRSATGFARRLTMRNLRDVLRTVGE
jgi:hypothetical protein